MAGGSVTETCQCVSPRDPRNVGPYLPLRRLGSGDMGWVYLSECLINRCLAVACRVVAAWRDEGAGPMISICEDQEPEEARACPGYAGSGPQG